MAEPAPRTPASRAAVRPGFVVRWALRAGLVAFGLVGAECAVRGLLAASGAPYSNDAARETVERHLLALHGGLAAARDERRDGVKSIQPFVGWWTENLSNQIDRVYNGGRVLRPRAGQERSFEIWLLGGSVAANFGVEGAGRLPFLEAIYTDEAFREVLAGRKPRMRNFAHAAFKQPQQLELVCFLLSLGLTPDAIVNLDGFNEVAVASENVALGSHPIYPAIAKWGTLARNPVGDAERTGVLVELWLARRRAERLAELVLDFGLYRSACVGRIVQRYVATARSDWANLLRKYTRSVLRAADDPALRGPALAPELAQDAMIAAWYESSAAISAICRGRGIAYLHVLQPTLHDSGAKRWTDEERAVSACSAEWLEGVRFGYPRLRAAGQRLHETLGVAFFDASHVFADVERTLYYDACHFNHIGNRMLAGPMAEAFVAIYAE